MKALFGRQSITDRVRRPGLGLSNVSRRPMTILGNKAKCDILDLEVIEIPNNNSAMRSSDFLFATVRYSEVITFLVHIIGR